MGNGKFYSGGSPQGWTSNPFLGRSRNIPACGHFMMYLLIIETVDWVLGSYIYVD